MQAAGVWPADPGRALEVLVERSLEGPVLRYSRRVALLEHAARLGIRRFDANLIIAGVQQRCSDSRALGPRPYRRTMWPGVALAMSVQMTLVLLAWFALG
jgi:hypothetical protein